MATYRSCGLMIGSDRDLPGLRPGDPAATTDLRIRTGPKRPIPQEIPPGRIVVDPDEHNKRFFVAVENETGYLLRFFGLMDVQLEPGLGDATVHLDPDGQAGIPDVLLSGTFLALVLSLRGSCVMHASAVAVNGQALAFVGHSGMGKSTLAIAACTADARLIAEDVLAVETESHPTCLPGNTDIRLRKAAVSLVERIPDATRLDTPDGRQGVQPPLSGDDPVPLKALVVPKPSRKAVELDVEVLSPVTALFRLMNFPRVNGLNVPAVVRQQFLGMGQIARTVPVLVATVPWGPPFAEDLGERITALVDHPTV